MQLAAEDSWRYEQARQNVVSELEKSTDKAEDALLDLANKGDHASHCLSREGKFCDCDVSRDVSPHHD
jgi:hypothetical protein